MKGREERGRTGRMGGEKVSDLITRILTEEVSMMVKKSGLHMTIHKCKLYSDARFQRSLSPGSRCLKPIAPSLLVHVTVM